MAALMCIVFGYIVGAYFMREHMRKLIPEITRREVLRTMAEYERDLVRRISEPASSIERELKT